MTMNYQQKISQVMASHYPKHMQGKEWTPAFWFLLNRLWALPNYSLYQARELVKMICRCAFNDSQLTDDESIVIMETCLDTRLDNILLEVNFNACW